MSVLLLFFFLIFMLLVGDFAVKTGPKHSAEVVSSVGKGKKAVM